MSEHTPGEWFLGDVQPWSSEQEIKSTERLDYHAAVQIDTDEGRANANLIAAAPELLEACKWARTRLVQKHLDPGTAMLEKAIAKAEGRKHGS